MAARFENGDETRIGGYHAHVYYGGDDGARERAARLRERVWNRWPDGVRMGRFRDRPVGPHPLDMYQIEFGPELFDEIVPWLMFNRDGLNILVHPEAGDAWRDHAWYPLWLGESLDLRLDWLAAGNRSA